MASLDKKDDTTASVSAISPTKGERYHDSAVHAKTQLVGDDSADPVYAAKATLLNDALQEIGMGRYQVRLAYSNSS